MFRTVLMFHPSAPMHFLMCDHQRCGRQVVCTLDPAAFKSDNRDMTAKYIEDTQLGFFKTLGEDGWLIGMNQTLCPVHARSRKYAQVDENAAIQRAFGEITKEQAGKEARIRPATRADLVSIVKTADKNGKSLVFLC